MMAEKNVEDVDSIADEKTEQSESQPFNFEKLPSLLLRFLNHLKRTGKTSNTISAYRNDLNLFSEFLIENKYDPQSYSFPLNEYYLHYLAKNGRRSVASTRRAIMSARVFLKFLIAEKVISGSQLLQSKSPKQPVFGVYAVSDDKYNHLVNTLLKLAKESDEKAIRDLAVILVFGECGLKASEAAALTWGDIIFSKSEEVDGITHTLNCSGYLRVKGANERLVPFPPIMKISLELLKDKRCELGLPVTPDKTLFFCFLNVTRTVHSGVLHRHSLKFIVYEICAEILDVNYNSETLRNRAILKWLEAGINPTKVAELAGFSSMHSLERFTRKMRNNAKPNQSSSSED